MVTKPIATGPYWDILRRLDLLSSKSDVLRLESIEDYYLYDGSAAEICPGGRGGEGTCLISENDYLGVGRENTRWTTRSGSLEGARMPFVLRRYPGVRALANAFWLMGEVYVRGIMHGEWVGRGDDRLETIHLV